MTSIFEMKQFHSGDLLSKEPLKVTHEISEMDEVNISSQRHYTNTVHPDYSMVSSQENLYFLTSQTVSRKRELARSSRMRLRRHGSVESDCSESVESQSESSANIAQDFIDEPFGHEEELELDYGLIDSETINLGDEKLIWETHYVNLKREPGFGFGIAISGGVDNPYFANGEASIAVSDVLKGGPAYGKLRHKDRIIAINGVDLEGEVHSTAISLLKQCGDNVSIVIRRRLFIPSPHSRQEKLVSIQKLKSTARDLGFEIGCKYYIKNVGKSRLLNEDQNLEEGDFVLKVNDKDTSNLSMQQLQRILERSKGKIELKLERPPKPLPSSFKGSMDDVRYKTDQGSVYSGSCMLRLPRGHSRSLQNDIRSPAPLNIQQCYKEACQEWLSVTQLMNSRNDTMRPRSFSSPKRLLSTQDKIHCRKQRAESFSGKAVSLDRSGPDRAGPSAFHYSHVGSRRLDQDDVMEFDNKAFIHDEVDQADSNSTFSTEKSSKDSGIWFVGQNKLEKRSVSSTKY